MYSKSIIILGLVSLITLTLGCQPGQNDNAAEQLRELTKIEKSVVYADKDFGLNLLRKLSSAVPNENLFISPLSVSIALGMTLNGASGDTYEAIKNTLKLNGLSEQEINEAYQYLIELLTNLDKEVILNIANSIWHRNRFHVEQPFLNANQEYFGATVQGLNFSDPSAKDIINAWVDDKTNGLINEILDKIPSNVVMYLINAIYFKGIWTSEFDINNTKNGEFINYDGSTSTVPMMFQQARFNYMTTNEYQAIDLMYGDSLFSMTIVVPKFDHDINNIIDTLDYHSIYNQLHATNIDLLLPKFELEWKSLLNEVLIDLGMGIAFGSSADFSRINTSEDLAISKVIHKTKIKVDEIGTEAAAVTSVGIFVTSLPQIIEFKVDRPFFFIIRDHHADATLFLGKVMAL